MGAVATLNALQVHLAYDDSQAQSPERFRDRSTPTECMGVFNLALE
jgi:hypothetical protein